MQLEHSFTVPVGIEDAWQVLLDIERVAPCMPGAALDSVDGDDFTGTVKVKLGPVGLTYKGKASFVEKDAAAHRAVIDARGRDARGNGTANALVTATLASTAGGDATTVNVVTDLNITGKPAQFGRGVMADVGNKLIGQFSDCLAGKLAAGHEVQPIEDERPIEEARAVGTRTDVETDAATFPDVPGAATTKPPAGGPSPPRSTPPRTVERPTRAEAAEVEPIDLLGSAGPAVAKRLAPLIILAIIALIVIRRRR